MRPVPVIAIDGPGGSGKSTVARAVAAALGLAHLDTGAMYRAVTWAALRDGIDLADGAALGRLAADVELEVGSAVTVDGVDATVAIRGRDVTAAVSQVSAHPEVRAELVARQRRWVGAHGGGVVEGRDIGSVVLPDADVKVYLTASDAERARRRAVDLAGLTAGTDGPAGAAIDTGTVAAELARRDRLDSTRTVSPLTVAGDAVVIDTTDQPVDAVVKEVLSLL